MKVRVDADVHHAAKVFATKIRVNLGVVVSQALRKYPAIKAELNGKEKR